MVSLDASLIWLIILFCALMIFLEKVAFKPTVELFEERRKRTYGRLERAKALAKEKSKLEEKYKSSIRSATEEGINTKKSIIEEGKKLFDEKISEERKKIGEIILNRKEEIAKRLEEQLSILEHEMRKPATKIAETLLGRNIQ